MKFVHHTQHKLHTIGNSEFVVDSLEVRMNGVRRNMEVSGNGVFRPVFKHTAHELQFTSRKLKACGNRLPGFVGKHDCVRLLPAALHHASL